MNNMNNVILRRLIEADTENVVKWRNSDFVRRNLFTQTELTPQQHLKYFENVVKAGKCAQYIIEVSENGVHYDIGTVFIKNIDKQNQKGEFGIFIGEENFRGKGYSLPATKNILKIAFSELELNRVYLTVMADNNTAISTYEKSGFIKEGIMKEDFLRYDGFVDIVIMGITKKMWLENNKEN